LLNIIEKKPFVKLVPFFKGFKGTIKQSPEDEHLWIMTGVWKSTSRQITVTELPPGRWTQDFKEYLDELIENKTITDFHNNSTTEDVHFEIFGYKGTNVEKDLKLVKTLRTSNMHLLHPTQGIKKYNSAEEILVDFVEIRLKYYALRKKYLVKVLNDRTTLLTNKARFVREVVDEEIIIFRQKKSVLEQVLTDREYMKVDGSFDYLLNIMTHQYTEEAIEKLETEVQTVTSKLNEIKKTTHVMFWKKDIELL